MDQVAELLREQDGVVARLQLLAVGIDRTAVARMLRRGELVAVHPGVYVEHNGPPSWLQRAWAAVLHAGDGAALCLDSALRAAEGPGRRGRDESVVHVAVDESRRVRPTDGVVVHRVSRLADRVQPGTPPRMRYEEAVLDLAAAARSDVAAIAVLADACGSRRTTAGRLLARVRDRQRLSRRTWLTTVLEDVAGGANSVLEHGYQTRVVRPHGLPRGRLQARVAGAGGVAYRDVTHDDLGLYVELDGRIFHTAAADRDRDLERDLEAAAVHAATTLRIGYRQVFDRPCRTAARVAAVMQRLGWTGRPLVCPECGNPDQPG